MTLGRALRILAMETKYEFLKLARLPGFAVPIVVFPLMFYAIFGLAFGRQRVGSATMSTYLIATMGAFGVIGSALFGLGVAVAGERGQGWLAVKRASPMPMSTYFGAKMLVSMLFSTIIVLLLFTLGVGFGGVRLPAATWVELGGALVLGSMPFCALGLAIGYLAGPNSASPIVNMIHLPMSAASGLWMPLEILPPFVRRIAPALPPFHLSQLALGTIGLAPGSKTVHVFALAAFAVAFLVLAGIGYRRDEGRTYG